MSNWLRSFWRAYALSWARLGKDRRAWPVFVRGTAALIGISSWLLFVSGLILPSEQRMPQFLFNSLVFSLGFIAFLGIRRLNHRDNALLNTSITGVPVAVPPSNQFSSDLREFLAERVHIVSLLLARALCELSLHAQHSPRGESVGRQVLNQALRERHLWEKLEPAEAELAAKPQGDWNENDVDLAIEWTEQLRLLRWLLRLDTELLPLAFDPHWDDLFTNEQFTGTPIQPSRLPRSSWEVRLERDSAELYLARTLAELDARHLLPPAFAPDGLREVRACLAGASTDLLVGTQAIEELPENDLRTIAATALARFNYASYLTELLETEDVMSFSHWLQRQRESDV